MSVTVRQLGLSVTVVAATALMVSAAVTARAQNVQSTSQVTSIPQGTRVRVTLQRALDSSTMDVGDKVRVQVAPDDPNGLPKNCLLVGRVTEVAPATKTAPGVIDVHFGALELAGGGWKGVSVDLAIGNQPKVDQTAGLAVTGRTTQQANTKLIGYGAGAGAVLGMLFNHNGRAAVKGGVVGALAGAVAAEATKGKTGHTDYQDVKLKAGTELTVTLNRPITVAQTTTVQ